MSIEAKATFLNELERRLSDKLTVTVMGDAMETLADMLCNYDIERMPDAADAPDDLLDAYIAAMQVEGKSPKTIERYKYLIRRMMAAVNVPTRQITVYHLRRYLADEKARGIQDSTLEGVRQVMTAYFNWLQRENLIRQNPTANLGVIRRKKVIRKAYSEIDLEKLKEFCKSARDKAIVCFLMTTGCRISEVTGLNRDDVDLEKLEAKVLGKGNKERRVYLNDVAGMAMRVYLESRTDDNPALFVNCRKERWTPNGVRQMMTELAKRSGVEHVHPHKFRRTLATNLIKHGMGIEEVGRILGHEKLDTTMKYVVLDDQMIKNSYRKYA